MEEATDTNAAIWKSDQGISHWVSTAAERERRRGEARRLMAELLPVADDERFTFVDLGAGTGAASKVVLDLYPGASAILADFSAQMMEEGDRVLAPYRGRYSYVEFDLSGGAWPQSIPDGVKVIISSLCVHHLTDLRKQQLFAEIRDHLAPGGWYFNYDPVSPQGSVVAETWDRVNDRRDPEAAAKRHSRTPEEQLRYENHVRYMIPLAPQLQFLASAGFEGVDVYWKELDYVIYGGRRPLG